MGETYTTVKLPVSLTKEADQLIARHYRGYRSRGELMADALRRVLDDAKGAA